MEERRTTKEQRERTQHHGVLIFSIGKGFLLVSTYPPLLLATTTRPNLPGKFAASAFSYRHMHTHTHRAFTWGKERAFLQFHTLMLFFFPQFSSSSFILCARKQGLDVGTQMKTTTIAHCETQFSSVYIHIHLAHPLFYAFTLPSTPFQHTNMYREEYSLRNPLYNVSLSNSI